MGLFGAFQTKVYFRWNFLLCIKNQNTFHKLTVNILLKNACTNRNACLKYLNHTMCNVTFGILPVGK